MSKNKVLIIGSKGFIGNNFLEYLNAKESIRCFDKDEIEKRFYKCITNQ